MDIGWIFENPTNYKEMTKKISFFTFWVTLFGLYLAAYLSSNVNNVMKELSCGLEYELGSIKLYFSFLYIPLAVAIFENIIHLHDKISDIIGIRYRFDKSVIIKKFLEITSLSDKLGCVNRKNRDKIMKNIFYKYASSTEPKIDVHLIHSALGMWTWFWIILDSTLVFLIIGFIYLLSPFSSLKLLLFILLVLLLVMFMVLVKNSCKKYAEQEVECILEDDTRKSCILEYLAKL